MTHTDVYKNLEKYIPSYSGENISVWFQNGKNSIRVRHINGQEFIFTFNDVLDWKLETIDSFIENTMKRI